jgi:NTP pyrophosphatase (non-canonical NTP hydrolase)
MLETNNLSEIVWYKYPKVCSTCALELNEELIREIESKKALKCRCDQTVEYELSKHVNNEILGEYRRLSKPVKLDEWVEMFNVIYGHRLHIQSLDSICFHFVEEVGEVTTALRNYKEFGINIDPENVDRDKLIKFMDPLRKNNLEYDLLKLKEKSDEGFFAGCQKILMDGIKEELADVFSWLCALVIWKGSIYRSLFHLTNKGSIHRSVF